MNENSHFQAIDDCIHPKLSDIHFIHKNFITPNQK